MNIRKQMKKSRFEKMILWGIASCWAIICIFPLFNMISVTFSSDSSPLTSTFIPNDFMNGLRKIQYALSAVNILQSMQDTFLYTSVTVLLILIISSLVAYEFVFYAFPLKKTLFALIMISMMLPLVMYIIPLYRFVFEAGLSDTILGVALPMSVSPLAVFMLMQFLEDLPLSFIESARIDGAGHFTIYWRIVLPLMKNGIITVTVVMFLRVWGQYLWPSLVTGQKIKPLSVAIANILNPNFWTDSRVRIAAMLLTALPPLLVYFFFQRQVIDGMAMSGIKG